MRIPFFEELAPAKNVLIAGMGGGFDVFAGLPLYVSLKAMGKTVHLANLSFTELGFCDGERPVPPLMRVTPTRPDRPTIFPNSTSHNGYQTNTEKRPCLQSIGLA